VVSGNAGGTAPRGSTGRNVIWLVVTTVILVLLLSYKTSMGGAPPAPPTQPPGVVDRPAGSSGPGALGQPDGQDGRAVPHRRFTKIGHTGGRWEPSHLG